MSSPVNYDANIFFASQIIRILRQGTSLGIDDGLYLDKVMEDILFIDEVLKTLYTRLGNTQQLMNRDQYLRDLFLAKQDFTRLLEDLIADALDFSSKMKQYHSRLRQIIISQKDDMFNIDDTLNHQLRSEEQQLIVSQEEFSILLDDSDSPQ